MEGGMTEPPARVSLTEDMIAGNISTLAKSANGLGLAFVKLEIHGSDVTDVDILANYPHLRYLDLSNNKISSFSPGLAPMSPLLSLDLHSNALTAFPASELAGKRYLQHINLSQNAMEGPDVGKDVTLPACTWLNLNENKLDGGLHFNSLPELLHFEARGCSLNSMKGIPAPKLQKLFLAGNLLTNVEGLEGKKDLQTLHLRDNQISRLDGFSPDLDRLTVLNLRSNKLESFDELSKLAVLPSMRVLSLQGNAVLEENASYRYEVIGRLKSLDRLDKEEVTPEEREDAILYLEALMKEREVAAAAAVAPADAAAE